MIYLCLPLLKKWHGNITKAFELNPLVFPFVILAGYFLISELVESANRYRILRGKKVQISFAVIVFGFTILRNLL